MNKDKDEIIKQREQMMKAHGWIVDAVIDNDCESGTGHNIHTHGIEENYGHLDLQCILPINKKVAHSIFCIVVEKIKEGKTFKAGKCYAGLVKNEYKIRFMEAEEGGRKVLRMILPDEKGKLHKNLMEESFRVKYS